MEMSENLHCISYKPIAVSLLIYVLFRKREFLVFFRIPRADFWGVGKAMKALTVLNSSEEIKAAKEFSDCEETAKNFPLNYHSMQHGVKHDMMQSENCIKKVQIFPIFDVRLGWCWAAFGRMKIYVLCMMQTKNKIEK